MVVSVKTSVGQTVHSAKGSLSNGSVQPVVEVLTKVQDPINIGTREGISTCLLQEMVLPAKTIIRDMNLKRFFTSCN